MLERCPFGGVWAHGNEWRISEGLCWTGCENAAVASEAVGARCGRTCCGRAQRRLAHRRPGRLHCGAGGRSGRKARAGGTEGRLARAVIGYKGSGGGDAWLLWTLLAVGPAPLHAYLIHSFPSRRLDRVQSSQNQLSSAAAYRHPTSRASFPLCSHSPHPRPMPADTSKAAAAAAAARRRNNLRRDTEDVKYDSSHAREIELKRSRGEISCAECRRCDHRILSFLSPPDSLFLLRSDRLKVCSRSFHPSSATAVLRLV